MMNATRLAVSCEGRVLIEAEFFATERDMSLIANILNMSCWPHGLQVSLGNAEAREAIAVELVEAR